MITVVKASPCHEHVRVRKFDEYFRQRGLPVTYWCWLRSKLENRSDAEEYLLVGGGYATKRLFAYYPLWVFIVFIRAVSNRSSVRNYYLAVDFDSALPVCLAKIFHRKIKFVYDIHDDFSLRYRFPKLVNNFISRTDRWIKAHAERVIHVDKNRVRKGETNYSIVPNTPKDIYRNYQDERPLPQTKKFAVTGHLADYRGIRSIVEFGKANPEVQLIVAGPTAESQIHWKSLLKLPNATYLGVLPQEQLFEQIMDCGGIFSLYSPDSEINRLAASNKLFDALMLGIPVITNYGLEVADFVKSNQIGFVVDYDFNETWDCLLFLSRPCFLEISKRCRDIYDRDFSYEKNVTRVLDDVFAALLGPRSANRQDIRE